MLDIRLVNPADDPEAVKDVVACQTRTYAEFGSEEAARTITQEEVDEGSVYFVTAQDKLTGELVGGVRFYLRHPGVKLPVEHLLDEHPEWDGYDTLRAEIKRWAARGLAESSGLWVSNRWRGTGLSIAMFRVAIAAMPLFGVKRSIAFTHQHVIGLWGPLGWTVDEHVCQIPYPDSRYNSSIIWIDPVNLSSATPAHRDIIQHHRRTLRSSSVVHWQPKNEHIRSRPYVAARST